MPCMMVMISTVSRSPAGPSDRVQASAGELSQEAELARPNSFKQLPSLGPIEPSSTQLDFAVLEHRPVRGEFVPADWSCHPSPTVSSPVIALACSMLQPAGNLQPSANRFHRSGENRGFVFTGAEKTRRKRIRARQSSPELALKGGRM